MELITAIIAFIISSFLTDLPADLKQLDIINNFTKTYTEQVLGEKSTSKLPKVTKVVDGDTIVVEINGQKETVRLLGIDTPESVDPRKPVECFALNASLKMKEFVLNKEVILVDEKESQGDRDRYGRLLRYVYLPDGQKTFVNGEMVKQGYAFSFREYPTEMQERFNTWEKYARDYNLGLWGSCNNER